MIETPIVARILGEGRRLVVGPPAIYHRFVQAVGITGGAMALAGLLQLPLPLWPGWWFVTGTAVGLAAVAAAYALQLVVFELKEKVYRRRQGPGLWLRRSAGKLSDLDAVVVIAEPTTRGVMPHVTYHVVLHWKPGSSEPVLVMHQDTRLLLPGAPLNQHAAPILALGARYAQALEVKFFDNTYFPSKNPYG